MKKITRKNIEKFLTQHASTKKVLDIGSGHVKSNHSYAHLFPNRYTVDIDSKREPDLVADVHDLPLNDSTQEVILCTEVLEHCHNPFKAISEMYRVLKPGGELILTTRFLFPLHDVPNDYFRFTKYGLQSLFSDWEIIELIPETKSFSAIGAFFQRIGFQTKLKGGKLSKVFVYLFAYIFDHLNWIISLEFGDIKKSQRDSEIFTTGYYMYAKKPEFK